MGLPISSYTIINGLWNNNVSIMEKAVANKLLNDFKLISFIIHDPESHIEFDQKLNFTFERLDYISGRDLLFFALVNPPQSWINRANQRNYFQEFSSWEINEFKNPRNAIISENKSITASSMANILGIPTESLPCIVITDNLLSKNFLWLKTCSNHLENQFQELGFIASKNVERITLLDEINDNKKKFDLCEGNGQIKLEVSLAKTLSEIMSFIIQGNNRNKVTHNQSRDLVNKSLSELNRMLNFVKIHYSDDDLIIFDELCIKISAFLALLNSNKNLDHREFLPINKEWLEPDSFYILQTAHLVYDLLVQENKVSGNFFGNRIELDFTPALICLAKIFEKEANLSVVHWLRKNLGINLPHYYNQYEPDKVARAKSGRLDVNFNNEKNGKWLPPGIGQSENVFRNYLKDIQPEHWDDSSLTTLMEKWKLIREKRNEAAHSERMDFRSLIYVKDSLLTLSENNIFERFYKMKMTYRGDADR
jgi:hypothetical protein